MPSVVGGLRHGRWPRRRWRGGAARAGETAAHAGGGARGVRAARPPSSPPAARRRRAGLGAAASGRRSRPVARPLRLGADVPDALRRLAARAPRCTDLRCVAGAWQVAHDSGRGLADALERAARGLRAAPAHAPPRRLRAGLGPGDGPARGLPAAGGPADGLGCGGDPWGFLLATPVGLGCLVLAAGPARTGAVVDRGAGRPGRPRRDGGVTVARRLTAAVLLLAARPAVAPPRPRVRRPARRCAAVAVVGVALAGVARRRWCRRHGGRGRRRSRCPARAGARPSRRPRVASARRCAVGCRTSSRCFASTLRAGAAPAAALARRGAALPGPTADRVAPVVARSRWGATGADAWDDPAPATPRSLRSARAMARAQASGASVVQAVERLADELERESLGRGRGRAPARSGCRPRSRSGCACCRPSCCSAWCRSSPRSSARWPRDGPPTVHRSAFRAARGPQARDPAGAPRPDRAPEELEAAGLIGEPRDDRGQR